MIIRKGACRNRRGFGFYRGGRVLDGVDGEAGLLDVELLAGHLVSLPLVHLLPLEGLHGAPLDVDGRRTLGLLKRVAVLDQLLVQALDLRNSSIKGTTYCSVRFY